MPPSFGFGKGLPVWHDSRRAADSHPTAQSPSGRFPRISGGVQRRELWLGACSLFTAGTVDSTVPKGGFDDATPTCVRHPPCADLTRAHDAHDGDAPGLRRVADRRVQHRRRHGRRRRCRSRARQHHVQDVLGAAGRALAGHVDDARPPRHAGDGGRKHRGGPDDHRASGRPQRRDRVGPPHGYRLAHARRGEEEPSHPRSCHRDRDHPADRSHAVRPSASRQGRCEARAARCAYDSALCQRRRLMLTRIALAVVISSLVAGPAFAQTGTTTGTGTVTGGTTTGTTTGGSTIGTGAPVTGGAFASLSPGNRKIAQALFEAQKAPATTTTTATSGTTTSSTSSTSATTSGPKPLTLDQIAQMKEGGRGWGNVFRQMKAQGLVDAKNLGSIVSASSKHHTTTVSTGGSPSGTTSGTTGGTTTSSTTASTTSGNGKATGSSGKGSYKSSGSEMSTASGGSSGGSQVPSSNKPGNSGTNGKSASTSTTVTSGSSSASSAGTTTVSTSGSSAGT